MRSSLSHVRSLLVSSLLITAIALGCKGSDPAPATTTDLSGNYKITAYTATDGKQTVDYVQVFTAFGSKCFQDLIVSLKSDGSMTSNNPASCSSGTDAIDDFKGGKWAVSGNTLSLTATGQSKEDWTYVLSGSKLTLTQTATVSGTSVTSKMELTKQ